MIISPRTGRALITKQDFSAVERFQEFAEALRLNFHGDELVGINAKLLSENLEGLADAMAVAIEARRKK